VQVGALVHSTSIMQAGRGALAVEDLDGGAEARTDGRQDEVRQAIYRLSDLALCRYIVSTRPREAQGAEGGAAEDTGPPPLPGSPARAEATVDLQGAREALRELGHRPTEGWLA